MAETNRSSLSNKDEGISPDGRLLMTVAFSIEGIIGVVCALYSLRRSLHRACGGALSFYTSLAVADLGIAALCPISAYASSVAAGGWPFSSAACDTYGFVALFFGSACIWSLLLTVAEEQHIAKGNQKTVVALLVTTWLNALFWAVAPILGWGRYIPESYDAGCLYEMGVNDSNTFTYFLVYPIGALVVPLAIMAYTNTSYGNFASKASFMVVLATFFCWGLYCIEELLVLVLKTSDAVPIGLSAAAPIIAKMSPIVNMLVVGNIASGLAPSPSSKTSRKMGKGE